MSLTRGVRRHHSEMSVLFASRNGLATTTQLPVAYPLEDNESVPTAGSNEYSSTSTNSDDDEVGSTTVPPIFPKW
jgi:hypothetical protein